MSRSTLCLILVIACALALSSAPDDGGAHAYTTGTGNGTGTGADAVFDWKAARPQVIITREGRVSGNQKRDGPDGFFVTALFKRLKVLYKAERRRTDKRRKPNQKPARGALRDGPCLTFAIAKQVSGPGIIGFS